MRVAPPVVIDSSQKGALEQWARSRSLPARQVERARVVPDRNRPLLISEPFAAASMPTTWPGRLPPG